MTPERFEQIVAELRLALAVPGPGPGVTPPVPVPPPPAQPPPAPAPAQPAGGRLIMLEMDWANPQRLFTKDAGGMGPDDVVVVRFTTGGNNSPANNLPRISAAEWDSPPSSRDACLSDKPGVFFGGVNGAPGAAGTGNTVSFPFSVGPNNTFFYPALAANKTYYLNIRNSAGATCRAGGVCNMFIDLQKPGGI